MWQDVARPIQDIKALRRSQQTPLTASHRNTANMASSSNDVVVEMTEIEHARASLPERSNGARTGDTAENNGDRDSDHDSEEEHRDDVVVVDNCHKTYLLGIEGVAALRGVSLRIKRGEFVMLFGTSGGGKSTLLNILGTIDKPTKGNVVVCGTRISESTKDSDLASLRLHKLGFVFQTFNLISQLSALENVEVPLTLHGSLSASERRTRSTALLKSVGMGDRLGHVPSQLSGGEQQRVTIARAMVNWPELLLLDEPTGDLDTKNTDIVMKILVDLNRKHGITMVMVTHDVHLREFADRILHMRDGKIAREEVMDQGKKQQRVAELFAGGDGKPEGVSGLREGASGVVNAGALDARGLSGESCRMTCVRRPEEYATRAAQVPVETKKSRFPFRHESSYIPDTPGTPQTVR